MTRTTTSKEKEDGEGMRRDEKLGGKRDHDRVSRYAGDKAGIQKCPSVESSTGKLQGLAKHVFVHKHSK